MLELCDGARAGARQAQTAALGLPGLHVLAVLSQDVPTVPVQQPPRTSSLPTLIDGEVVFEDPSLGSR